MKKLSELVDGIKFLIKDLRKFHVFFIIYVTLSTLFSLFIILLLLGVAYKLFPDALTPYCDFLYDSKNVETIIYLSLFFTIVMSSIAYLTHLHIESSSLSDSNSESDLSEKLETIVQKIDIHLNSQHLKIISYEDLVEIENNYPCESIYIITNDLTDDLNDDHFFNIILDNIIKGKKYKFITPNVSSNKHDGCSLLTKLDNKLKENNVTLQLELGRVCDVYLVLDEVFRICAFRDIAIYGAAFSDSKALGYVELPYIDKSRAPNDRFFIQIDDRVCRQIVTDVDSILEKSNYATSLSCEISDQTN